MVKQPFYSLENPRVTIRRPQLTDLDAFAQAMKASEGLHEPWVSAPTSELSFRRYIKRVQGDQDDGFLVLRLTDDAIVGVINLNVIIYAALCSAYLGYYGVAEHVGKGYMREGMMQVINLSFSDLGLHRLEANIQPDNNSSLALVKSLGFQREGFSPRYLKIGKEWRDHERWALLADSASKN
jgi:ribosomal-protein-alanine N-acetyltransferase